MLSDRVELSSADARVEEIKGGPVGVVEQIRGSHREDFTPLDRTRTHTEPKLCIKKVTRRNNPVT